MEMVRTGPIGQLVGNKHLQHLIKFCIVGVSSLAIDLTIFTLLLAHVAPIFALAAAFVGGVSNSFFWNSRWTFAGTKRNLKRQVPLFFGTNLIGFLLTVLMTTGALVIAAHLGLTEDHHTPQETLRLVFFRADKNAGFSVRALLAAKMCAAVVVMAWNFTATKFITFRDAPEASAAPGETSEKNG